MPALFPRPRTDIAPGAVHLPGWLDVDAQRRLAEACQAWAAPPAGLRTTRLPSGGVMSVRTVCLGWHWYPYGYSRTVPDEHRTPVKPFPTWLADLGRQAVADAYGDDQRYQPDVALVNHYDDTAKMGLHQDKDEHSPAPVVSLSIGDTCVFRFGNTETRSRPWTDIELRSGDLFVFGGPARLAYHGVPRTLPGTADPALGMPPGRWNVTLRESGLTDPCNRSTPVGVQ
jgi:alkylated DNA repair protein (DNA oxidative demethylase)